MDDFTRRMLASDKSPAAKSRPETSSTELKSAAQLYWLYAFILALPIGMLFSLGEKPDRIGIFILFGFCIYILLLILTGVLLFKKKKAGLYLGWVLLPLLLLAIPIGTAIGVFIIKKITKPEVKALLA